MIKAVIGCDIHVLQVEPRKFSIYREEAVDAITEALDGSLTNEKIRENCCRALLILGGQFSCSGKLLTETWILNQAGYFKVNPLENIEDDNSFVDDSSLMVNFISPCALHFEKLDVHTLFLCLYYKMQEDEGHSNEWLRNLSTSLLGNGKRSFLEAISRCLESENLDLIRVCLTTVAWLSSSLSSVSDSELQIPAFSVLIPRLKESLENGQQIEHKILASSSLLSFSKISGQPLFLNFT